MPNEWVEAEIPAQASEPFSGDAVEVSAQITAEPAGGYGEEYVIIGDGAGGENVTQAMEQAVPSALEQRIDAMGTTDLLLLMIFCLLFLRTVIGLFTRKWGVNSW